MQSVAAAHCCMVSRMATPASCKLNILICAQEMALQQLRSKLQGRKQRAAPVQDDHVGQVGQRHVAVGEVEQVLVVDAGDRDAVLAHCLAREGRRPSTARRDCTKGASFWRVPAAWVSD